MRGSKSLCNVDYGCGQVTARGEGRRLGPERQDRAKALERHVADWFHPRHPPDLAGTDCGPPTPK